MKSTLTALLGLILLIGVAILAYSKSQDQPKTISKKTRTNDVSKSTHERKVSKEEKKETELVKVQFGLNANFGSNPKTEH